MPGTNICIGDPVFLPNPAWSKKRNKVGATSCSLVLYHYPRLIRGIETERTRQFLRGMGGGLVATENRRGATTVEIFVEARRIKGTDPGKNLLVTAQDP
jgi:hypothetical protein